MAQSLAGLRKLALFNLILDARSGRSNRASCPNNYVGILEFRDCKDTTFKSYMNYPKLC